MSVQTWVAEQCRPLFAWTAKGGFLWKWLMFGGQGETYNWLPREI